MPNTSKNTFTTENKLTVEAPTVVEEIPTVVEEAPTVVEEAPTVVEEAPTVVEEVATPAPEPEPVTTTFSPETFSTELVMNTKRRATARETGPVRRRRLRHLGYI